jgi:hypothetical protein
MNGGEAYAVAFFSGTVSFTESLVGSVPPLTLTVIDSFFDTVGSIGNCALTGSLASLPFISSLNSINPYTSLDAAVFLEDVSLQGTTGLAGDIRGIVTAYDSSSQTTVTGLQRPFTLTRGGSSPV